MKNFCVVHILLLFLMMLIYKLSGAQDFVVTTKGDTLSGKVKVFNYGPEKKVQVIDDNKQKNTFSIFEVRTFSLKDDRYAPMKGPEGYTFMKIIQAGYLSLYAFQLPNQMTYDGRYLFKKDGQGMEVPNLTFKKNMTRFLSDCPRVSESIDNGDLGKTDLEKIVTAYNDCIATRTYEYKATVVAADEQTEKISAWDVLEEQVKAKPDFAQKADALDMIKEIKIKVGNGERVPNFLVEGLKESLKTAEVSDYLDNALEELNQ